MQRTAGLPAGQAADTTADSSSNRIGAASDETAGGATSDPAADPADELRSESRPIAPLGGLGQTGDRGLRLLVHDRPRSVGVERIDVRQLTRPTHRSVSELWPLRSPLQPVADLLQQRNVSA